MSDVRETRASLVNALRRARAAQHVTQEDLADALGLSRSSVVRLEGDGASPLLDNLIRAFHALGYELVAVPAGDPAALSRHAGGPPAPRRVDRA